tara:strand:+ start:3991 stop:4602 length:612 start_codon:yes stop_codon:yes gene_type:complete
MVVVLGQRPVKMGAGSTVRLPHHRMKPATVETMTVTVKSMKAVVVRLAPLVHVAVTSVSVDEAFNVASTVSGIQPVREKSPHKLSCVTVEIMTVMAKPMKVSHAPAQTVAVVGQRPVKMGTGSTVQHPSLLLNFVMVLMMTVMVKSMKAAPVKMVTPVHVVRTQANVYLAFKSVCLVNGLALVMVRWLRKPRPVMGWITIVMA